MTEDEAPPVVFTPENEPYLGRLLLHHFDETIVACLESNQRVARYTHAHSRALTELQQAASQIIPHGINLALSIRELVRQGYLFGAVVLLRSLVERAGIISYLEERPAAIEAWKDGWKHGKRGGRPSLGAMLEVMGGKPENDKPTREAARLLHHIAHGDPVGSLYNLAPIGEANLGYSVSKSLDDPDLCDFICQQAMCYLIVLSARMNSCFPKAFDDGEKD
jgi:hypothetical protein